MLPLILGLPLLLGAVSMPAMVSDASADKIEVVNQAQPKLVVYNDTELTITLDAYELNEYTYNHLSEYVFGLPNFDEFIVLTYNGLTFNFDEFVSNPYLSFVNGSYTIALGDFDESGNINKWHYYNDTTPLDFEYNLILSFVDGEDEYLTFKNLIEQDIVANTESMPTIANLFEPITQAITSFVGALGQAFSSVTALFWTTGENAGPTFLGLLVLIGVGVGLIYGAYRIIKGLMHRI